LAAAEAALDSGEYPAALELLGTAGHRRDAKTLLSWVRAYLGSGDLVAAETELARIEASTLNPDDFWAAKVERAELLYKRGEFANVESLLCDIDAAPRSTRLRGRNTLGKVLLAQSKWDEADRHFADDAQEAAALGDTAGELRAQINRGIAHLSTGQMERAEQTFRRVLQEAEANREHMLAVFAMANLAVVAMRTFRYGDALQFWERTVRLQHATRNPETTGRALANLAALRLRLGALSHAEHAIRFARRAFEGRGLAWLMTHLGTEMAGIALARGDIGEARQAIREALSKAKDSNKRGEAFALSARIALEDGDVQFAASELAKACELKTSDWTRAEIAIVRTLLARARGDVGQVELAVEAASYADAAHDEELRREALTVLAQALGDTGDLDGARRAIGEAIALRDRVAASLDTEQRAGYLAKPSVSGLTKLASLTSLANATEEDEAPKTIRSRVGATVAEAPRTLIGDDPQMRALRGAIKKIAKTTTTVLVHGESGTGKELVAAALHAESERAQGPFVALNCAALAETLLLSELFGHERGAFTGAAARKRGRFEVAEGGTLFLDEIGDISPATQVALLRVLQEKTFERVGGTQSIRANVRIICATHRDLRGMVERGEFREDLYYRLRQVVLEVPALRQRPSDIAKLAQHLLERVAQERSEAPRTLDGDAAALLSRHRWPGLGRERPRARGPGWARLDATAAALVRAGQPASQSTNPCRRQRQARRRWR
jgi:tetratricopeptide (TPR) repeat protein